MSSIRSRAEQAADRTRRAAASTGSSARRAGHAVRQVTDASGAGRTGLGRLIELNALNSAGDVMLALALVSSLFFGLPVDEARGRVALYLLLAVVPFAIVAPFIGPALDRLRSARRFAIAATMLARGLLCWGMAGAVLHNDSITLLPAAFGVLVLSKVYGISRSAVTPRVLPAEITLVTANARCSLAGLIAAVLGTGVAGGVYALGGWDWVLRVASLVFIGGMVLAIRMPKHLDVPEVAVRLDLDDGGDADPATAGSTDAGPGARPGAASAETPDAAARPRGRRLRTLRQVGPVVAEALGANAAIRVFCGFMVLFCAFVLRIHQFDGVSEQVALGVLVIAAGVGGLTGTALGAVAKSRAPHVLVFGTLSAAAVAAALGSAFFGLAAISLVSFVAAFAQALGKLSMDAIVQREIGEQVRSSTFAVSETLYQLAWVLGGLLGLSLALAEDGTLPLALLAAGMTVALAALLVRRTRRLRAWRAEGRIAGRHGAPDPASPTP